MTSFSVCVRAHYATLLFSLRRMAICHSSFAMTNFSPADAVTMQTAHSQSYEIIEREQKYTFKEYQLNDSIQQSPQWDKTHITQTQEHIESERETETQKSIVMKCDERTRTVPNGLERPSMAIKAWQNLNEINSAKYVFDWVIGNRNEYGIHNCWCRSEMYWCTHTRTHTTNKLNTVATTATRTEPHVQFLLIQLHCTIQSVQFGHQRLPCCPLAFIFAVSFEFGSE